MKQLRVFNYLLFSTMELCCIRREARCPEEKLENTKYPDTSAPWIFSWRAPRAPRTHRVPFTT